jgi:hypothetical protein
MKTIGSFLGTVMALPTPPILAGYSASQGVVTPQGMFGGGEAYKRRTEPFDQNVGLPVNLEQFIRTMGTGLGSVVGQSAAAYLQTPEGMLSGIKNAFTQAGKAAIQKDPILRNITGIKQPQSGTTNITSELFKKQKAINILDTYLRKYSGEQLINTQPASAAGAASINLAAPTTGQRTGLGQPPPTNPLYTMFIQQMHNKFVKDAPKIVDGENIGGIGYKTAWRWYGNYTQQLQDMHGINDGSNVTWQERLNRRPEVLKELRDNNIDTTNMRSVRNYWERKRQDAARSILQMVRSVEKDFSQQTGKPITLEMLDPYGKGLKGAPAEYAYD